MFEGDGSFDQMYMRGIRQQFFGISEETGLKMAKALDRNTEAIERMGIYAPEPIGSSMD